MSGEVSSIGGVSMLPGAAPQSSAIDLYARDTAGYADRVAATLAQLQAAAAEFPGQVVLSTSLGAEDMVLTDLVARHQLPIAIATLETGALHAETVALISRIEQHYGVKLEVFRPKNEAVIEFVKTNGDKAMYESIALRKACCGIRKMEPLSRMLADRKGWITGLRREQSANRAVVPARDTDKDANGGVRIKFNPLADWTWADVWQYIATNNVPYNPLHDQFMPSIGCAPCTRAIAVGEEFRAGRWWWEDESAKECGLHVKKEGASA